MIRVVAITGGKNVPSRRFRIKVVIPFLRQKGFDLVELCPIINCYPPKSRLLRLPWFALAIVERIIFVFRSRGCDAVILQREMISTLFTLEWLMPKPRVLDVDDAIYLYNNASAARKIAQTCSLVVCGNQFLAEQFSKWNSNVVVIPTGIDTKKLRPIEKPITTTSPTIGWIGTSGNYKYLELIEPALRKIFALFPNVRLQVISNERPMFFDYLGDQLDFRLWRPGIENDLLPQLTIGIMPLIDSEWEWGKCSFKMLQYMAAGIPVVVSPVGMNAEILASGSIGLAANNTDEWVEALSRLLQSSEMVLAMGMNGRKLVESEYSLSVVSLKWQKALSNLICAEKN